MLINQKYSPNDFGKQYNIDAISAANGYVCIHIKEGVNGLNQAAVFA